MKRLILLLLGAFHICANAQSYAVWNMNDDYVAADLYSKNFTDKPTYKIVKDNTGLYWFQGVFDLFSFDGVNWRTYDIKSLGGKNSPIRINDMELVQDSIVLLGTSSGMYLLERPSETFVPLSLKFPGIKGLPLAVSSFYQVWDDQLAFTSQLEEGFYLFDWKTKKIEHIYIDKNRRTELPDGTEIIKMTSDKGRNIWGNTSDKSGIWNYDRATGKIRCSWKGELPQFAASRFQNVVSLTYCANEEAMWLSYGDRGYLEKIYPQTGKSFFYSFNNNLQVHADSAAPNKYTINHVKPDKNNHDWVKVGDKFLVKLDKNIEQMQYLVNDPNTFSIGDWNWFKPENPATNKPSDNNDILLWVKGAGKFCMVRKRNSVVRQVPFDTSSALVKPQDYINDNNGHQTIYFEKGKNGRYFLLQKNPGRPKLICFDDNLRVTKVLFNDQQKNYVAFFGKEFNPDTFFIAFMRPDPEPVDFRELVAREFKVDLRTFKVEEIHLSFPHRVWRYGSADANNIYWLFSNGILYSYDPVQNLLDSIFISEPAAKRSYRLDLVKGYDYPTVLHKKSSTFWIDFIPTRELYKINLKTRKIDRIFNCCPDREDCSIGGPVFDLYNFDNERIYLQQTSSALLVNPSNDSITSYFDLFPGKPAIELQNGSGLYKNWTCLVLPSHIYFLNNISGQQKELSLNRDFKWRISQLNSRPLMNDRGELILMSSANRGFLVIKIDSVPAAPKPGNVQISFISLDNKPLPVDSLINGKGLSLKFNRYKSIHLGFSDHSVFEPGKIRYQYTLYKGRDTFWIKIEGEPELSFSDLSPAKYQLLLRADNGFGDYSEKVTALTIEIRPPFWRTWWFPATILAAVGLIFYLFYRYRLLQLKKLQTIRNNIASDLHDDIGSTLNSISIYSQVARQQAGKEIPALDVIGINSRMIIENMSDIVWTINPENDSFEKIIVRMRSFAHQLFKARQIEYRFDVDESLNAAVLPMQVRKNFYLVFKEAITNLLKYSGATGVQISLTEKNKTIILAIRDNGSGIPENAESLGNGLMNMKRRAEEIRAQLKVISIKGEGTNIQLMLRIPEPGFRFSTKKFLK